MILKFYKNCILNESYTEVFDVFKSNKLRAYLNTLESHIVELPDETEFYLTRTGRISIDRVFFKEGTEYDIAPYNYLEFLDPNEREGLDAASRFYFINNMELRNDLYYITYTEDVWHNYARYMHIRNSRLIRSKVTNYAPYHINQFKLPIDYTSNKEKLLTSASGSLNRDCYLIAKIQEYTTAGQGTETDRYSYFAVISNNTDTISASECGVVMSDATLLVKDSGIVDLHLDSSHTVHYEISDIYIVPKSIFTFGAIPSSVDYRAYATIGESTYYLFNLIDILYKEGNNYVELGSFKTGKQYLLDNNFKRQEIGIYTNRITVQPNGRNYNFSFKLSCGLNNINLIMEGADTVRDITSDFSYDVPITALSSEQLAIEQVSRAMKVVSLPAKLINPMQWGNIAQEQMLTHGNFHTSNKSVETPNNSLAANCFYGFMFYSIVSDNEVEVNNAIKNEGYIVDEYVSDEITRDYVADFSAIEKYNVIRFDTPNIYGAFSTDIANRLKQILTNGVQIWYDVSAINV